MTFPVAAPEAQMDRVGAPPGEILRDLPLRTLSATKGNGDLLIEDEAGWLLGSLDVEDGGAIESAAREAYARILAALAQRPGIRLLRLWNYIPRIHDEEAGLERYRAFNSGRQQAFIEAGVPAFEGSPAACALGRPDGPLSIRFLAAPIAARMLENPRQTPAWRYDRRYGPRSPTFSRGLVAGKQGDGQVLLVSGTASIVGQDTVHPGDVAAQTEETLKNLTAVCTAAGNGFALPSLAATVYLRHPADRPLVEPLLARAGLRVTHWLQADICRRDLLIEIEGHALGSPEGHQQARRREGHVVLQSSSQEALEGELAQLTVDCLHLDRPAPSIDPEMPLFGDGLGLDSIDLLEVALEVSHRYGFQLRSDNEDKVRIFKDLRSLAAHVATHRTK